MELVTLCLQNPGLEAYLFRRTLPELEDNHIRPLKSELPTALWTYNDTKHRFQFYNGSGINCCYCEKEDDVRRYQGAEIHVLGIDEAAHLSETQITYLRTRVRLGDFKASLQYAPFLPRIVMGSNPGGPGHNFLRQVFLDPAPPETLFFDKTTADPEKGYPGMETIFIPAKMSDNRYLDEGYSGQFTALSPELARALRDGDWDAVIGQALHTLSRDRHMLRAFEIPKHWTRFMSMDWGSARPFSVGWYAVSEGAILAARDGWPERYIPAGALVRYREHYGWNGRANNGCRLDSGTVARKIIEIEKEARDVMDYRIGDNAMWAVTDGPCVEENMRNATEGRLVLRPSKKDRTVAYAEILSRLAGNPDFRETGEEMLPMLYVTANCVHFWRTCPTLVLDSTDPEKGPDTDQEDHCLVGETMVLTPHGERRIDSLPDEGSVWTADGWRPYMNLGKTAENAEIWRLDLEDGRTIDATPSHRFMLADGSYRRLDELDYSCYLVHVPFREEIAWRNTSTAKRSGSAAGTTSGTGNGCIGLFGSTSGGLFRTAFMSTTSMATGRTTTFPTWNFWPPLHTSSIIRTSPRLENISGCTLSASGHWHRSGTVPTRGGHGIRSMPRKVRISLQGFLSRALCAARKVWENSGISKSVPGPVSPGSIAVKIRAITRMPQKRPVYNLHVPDVNNFAVAGGTIVHNCYDEVVYALRSRPYVSTKQDRYMAEHGKAMRAAQNKVSDPYATA